MAATPDFTKLHEFFSKKSTMEILGVDRDENAHSKFLGWLFENEETRITAINSMIRLWKEKAKKKLPIITNEEYKNAVNENIQFPEIEDKSSVEVKLEDFVVSEDSNCYGRADIVINITDQKGNRHIIIENKIDSLEHKMGNDKAQKESNWQTIEYFKYYTQKYYGKDYLFFFLTRPKYQITISEKQEKEQLKKEPQCQAFIGIDYQDIIKILKNITVDLTKDKDEKTAERAKETRHRINDYIYCLGINKTQNTLMAVSGGLKTKVEEAWKYLQKGTEKVIKENQDILRPLFEVLNHINKEDDKKDNKIERIYTIIKGKDYTSYNIEDTEGLCAENLTKNGLVKSIIELYIRKEEVIECKKLKEIFSPALRMICKGSAASSDSLSNQVVINLDEYWKKKNKYLKSKNKKTLSKDEAHENIQNDGDWRVLSGANNCYVIQTGWDGRPMMNNFIEYAERIMPSIKIKECVKEKKLNEIIRIISK